MLNRPGVAGAVLETALSLIKFHSEILALLNFNKSNIFPLDLRTTIHWNVILEIFNIIIYFKIGGKIPDHNLSAWLLFNPRDKVQILVESTGQICPAVLHIFWPRPLDLRINIHLNVDLVFFQQSWHIYLCWKNAKTTFQCMVVLQSRGQNFILFAI